MTPEPRTGRGAWNRGPSCPTGYYSIVGTTNLHDRVGAAAYFDRTLDPLADHERAVNLGAKAVQRRMNALQPNLPAGLSVPQVSANGVWGMSSHLLARALQIRLGVPNPDGIVGPITSKAFFHSTIDAVSLSYRIPWNLLPRVLTVESDLDAGAVGESTPDDKGFAQLNLPSHPSVSLEEAFDPVFASDYAGGLLRGGHDKWKRVRPTHLRTEADFWHCAVVGYNSPATAKHWAETGELLPRGEAYLTKVLAVTW